MLILSRGLQRVTTEHQSRVTTACVKDLVNSLSSSMDKKFHRIEYNAVLSETTILDPRFKKADFSASSTTEQSTKPSKELPQQHPGIGIHLTCKGVMEERREQQHMSRRSPKHRLFGGFLRSRQAETLQPGILQLMLFWR
jgi:hypothetical protein